MTSQLADEEGFWQHCEVASFITNSLPINPHTKHHIRGAIREASKKVTTIRGKGKDIAPNISEEAYKVIKSGSTRGLVLEHVVPISVMNEYVLNLGKQCTTKLIGDIVLKWTVLSVITTEEHDHLSSLKLTKSMPDDWDQMDKYARYDVAGIKLLNIGYKEAINGS